MKMYMPFYMRGIFPLSLISKTWNKILVLKKRLKVHPLWPVIQTSAVAFHEWWIEALRSFCLSSTSHPVSLNGLSHAPRHLMEFLQTPQFLSLNWAAAVTTSLMKLISLNLASVFFFSLSLLLGESDFRVSDSPHGSSLPSLLQVEHNFFPISSKQFMFFWSWH